MNKSVDSSVKFLWRRDKQDKNNVSAPEGANNVHLTVGVDKLSLHKGLTMCLPRRASNVFSPEKDNNVSPPEGVNNVPPPEGLTMCFLQKGLTMCLPQKGLLMCLSQKGLDIIILKYTLGKSSSEALISLHVLFSNWIHIQNSFSNTLQSLKNIGWYVFPSSDAEKNRNSSLWKESLNSEINHKLSPFT